jgi:leucyl-tRNA synthetase
MVSKSFIDLDKNNESDANKHEINWSLIEQKWTEFWNQNKINNSDIDYSKQKFFITVAYPYPNSPQHIGHGRTYTLADVHARYYKMKGFNVLFPMGFHYTGTPILGMSKRVQSKDTEIIDNFKNIYLIDQTIIDSFVDPLNIAKYFHNEIKSGMVEMGYSIDWRREFTTIDPIYKKFISWQFKTLRKLGVIEQGSHPVGWCPNDENPVSQHDTLGDIEPSFTEYYFIKFKLESIIKENNDESKVFLPTGTLRPETLYGTTNLWVNDNETYIKVLVNNDEKWIISKPAFKKLELQNYNLKIVSEVKGSS